MLAAVAAFVCLCATSAFAMGADYLYVSNPNGSGVNMRTGPSTNYPVITTLSNGTQVYVLTADAGLGWTQVSYGSSEGWMATYLLSSQPGAVTGGGGSTAFTGSRSLNGETRTITGQGVNLRTGPGTGYGVLTVMPAGAQVAVYDYGNGWAHVYYLNNYEGYCSTSYVSGLGGTTGTGGSNTGKAAGGNPANTWYGGHNYANVYNYYNYRSMNPDLVSNFGNNVDAYLQHFVNYGMAEGRQAIYGFNVHDYRAAHPDLDARFGDNLRMYYLYACGLA